MARIGSGSLLAVVLGLATYAPYQSANAVFLSVEGGSVTLDGASGLEWLDFSESTPFAYSEIPAATAPGGALEGYRLASRAEVETLFQNAGVTTILPSGNSTLGYSAANAEPITRLQELMGVTHAFTNLGVPGQYTYGYSADLDGSLSTTRAFMPGMGVSDDGSEGFASLGMYSNPLDAPAHPTYGSWLVSTSTIGPFLPAASVPEPAMVLLLVPGAVALRAFRRRHGRPSFRRGSQRGEPGTV